MKHRGSSKIKYQHHMIRGLRELLERIERWPEIQSIIPARIKPTAAHHPGLTLKVQYAQATGLKCLARASDAAQEVFFVTHTPDALKQKIDAL